MHNYTLYHCLDLVNISMKLKLTLLFLFIFFNQLTLATELGQLSPAQLIKLQKQQNALVIDIRTEKEWAATGIIPDSHKLQFFSSNGKYNPQQWLSRLEQLKTSNDQPVILVCRSGSRSSFVGDMLIKKGMKNVHHLSTGILPWIKAGNKISKDCPTQLACK